MSVYTVPCVKGKATVEIDSKDLPDHVFQAVMIAGMKHYVNSGMTPKKLGGYTGDELKAKAMEIALANVEAMKAGTIRIVGHKASGKTPGKVMTEARRIAKGLIKEDLKRRKIKVSHIEAKELTKAANALIEANPEIVKQAEAAIAAQEAQAGSLKIDVSAIPISEKKVEKAEKDAAAKKQQLSATQAGKVKARPQANA